jgi:hypothetical protein
MPRPMPDPLSASRPPVETSCGFALQLPAGTQRTLEIIIDGPRCTGRGLAALAGAPVVGAVPPELACAEAHNAPAALEIASSAIAPSDLARVWIVALTKTFSSSPSPRFSLAPKRGNR